MATGKDIRAGRAFVELFTTNTGLEKGLKDASARLKSWGTSLVGVGAIVSGAGLAIIGPLAGAVKVAADMGEELQNAADQTGDTVENLGALAAVAAESGLAMDDLLQALFRFQKEGGKGVEDFAAQIDKLAESPDAAAQAFDLFGKAGAKMLRLARGTEGGLSGMIRELKEAGVLMSGDDAKAADTFGDSLGRLQLYGRLATAAIGSALIPTLQKLIGPLTHAAGQAIQFVRANGQLVITIAGVGLAILAAGATITAFGLGLIGVAAIISALGTVVGFLLSPIGILASLLIGLGAAFLATGENAANMFAEVRAGLIAFVSGWRESINAIVAALSAGKIELAWKIAWTNVKISFLQFREWLSKQTAEMVNDLQTKTAHLLVDFALWLDRMSRTGPFTDPEKIKKIKDANERFGREFKAELDKDQKAQDQARPGNADRLKEIAELQKMLAALQAQANAAAAAMNNMKPPKIPGIEQGGPMGIAGEVKGTFSSQAIQESLAISDKLADRTIKELQHIGKGVDDVAGLLKNMKGLLAE